MKPNMRHPFGVPRIENPLAEGRFHLRDGRRLGYAEFGDPSGAVVLWFHGTLGARRQFPMLGRRAAEKLGLRVVVVERPARGCPIRTATPRWPTGSSTWRRWPTRSTPSG
jgi:hypothetical protein